MGFVRALRLGGSPRSTPIAVLDIGTTKVVCLIARYEEGGGPRVLGVGHQASAGLKSGAVVDMDAAEKAIARAISAAERAAGLEITAVTVNLSGGYPVSHTVGVEVAIQGHAVTDADLDRVLRAHGHEDLRPDAQVVHAIPVSYAIDGARGIHDPRGMYGDQLGVDLHLVTAGSAAIRNLTTCINRAGLDIEGVIISSYASALATLVEDEKELGCTVVEMGGGTTGIAVFAEGRMVFADTLPVGGLHVTNDVARGLTCGRDDAERLKTLHGGCQAGIDDETALLAVPQVGEDQDGHVEHFPRSLLIGVIQPRVEEILELVRGRLEASGFDRVAGRRVVLSGGASQLQGIREMAHAILNKQVRLGRPVGVHGLAPAVSGPAFATAAGLLLHGGLGEGELILTGADDVPATGGLIGTGFLGRIGGWLREHL